MLIGDIVAGNARRYPHREALIFGEHRFTWAELDQRVNRLEPLKGNRKGQHSIRINDQWRICFTWTDDDATNVEITDYH